jgi:hypothetical protein
VLLAVSTLLAASPRAVASQMSANANIVSTPSAPSQRNGSAVGRKRSVMPLVMSMSFYAYDTVNQRLSGRHYYFGDGAVQPSPIEMRYAWPAELDLMARLAGLRLEHRWGGWKRVSFTGLSPSHVSVYAKS